jgi:hypothetical protein
MTVRKPTGTEAKSQKPPKSAQTDRRKAGRKRQEQRQPSIREITDRSLDRKIAVSGIGKRKHIPVRELILRRYVAGAMKGHAPSARLIIDILANASRKGEIERVKVLFNGIDPHAPPARSEPSRPETRRVHEDGPAREDSDRYKVGYKCPPRERQFAKGQSGNPGGRPGRKLAPLGKMLGDLLYEWIRYTENGIVRRAPRLELIVKAFMAKALKGDVIALRIFLKFDQFAEVYGEINPIVVNFTGDDAEI